MVTMSRPGRNIVGFHRLISLGEVMVLFAILFEPEPAPRAEFRDIVGIRMESSRESVVVNLWEDWAIGVSWLYVIE